ncbi:hypothetical protein B0H34DRAFT_648103 [Crassisporium funariophilum]|nr:hypothetical protein B0H34DRAFT_648103 [Crassisporium funariophilum]
MARQQQTTSAEHSFTPLSVREELDIDDETVRGGIYGNEHEHEGSVDGDTLAPHSHSSQPLLPPHLLNPPEILDPNAGNYGLPTYQANVSQAHFDFSRMEEFAVAEKARLGINSPINARFSLSGLRGRAKPNNNNAVPSGSTLAPSDADAELAAAAASSANATAGDPLRPLRHRKLSQSNPHPRSHRKGIGGKMALFESTTNDTPSFSARLGLSLSSNSHPPLTGGGVHMPSGPEYDHIAGIPSTAGLGGGGGGGILNTGHDRPYRFSFYSNALSATIHARSLSELPAEGQTFEQLFSGVQPSQVPRQAPPGMESRPPSAMAFSPPYQETMKPTGNNASSETSSSYFPPSSANPNRRSLIPEKPQNGLNLPHTPSPSDPTTWWLDVQSPTDEEMKMLSKVFSIHPLTTEDILMEETREKIELFRNYYLVCFRSFDQDVYSPTHLEPLNMYIIVFREGTLSFHFRPTPHPQNVRRRITQLKDYISCTSDWISYALIDDITDAFGPLIQGIEYEVDSIDELVLILKEAEQSDMLRRIGTCRKKVMGLLRLMGNKADVVKGLAKRCNENWRVAPTSDIGLYLSDIQDHLITMTQNLNHYEKILSRSHSNYLAQISIEMTDANNQINDVLSKLTALGTVLIPMNLVTGLWGMNVHVPGQETAGYAWFISIIACLAAFALVGGYSTYKFMVRR